LPQGRKKFPVPGKFSRRLVIDSDVMQSAGGAKAGDSTSIRCREILRTILKVCHRVVETPEIVEEQRRHLSRFSRTWLVHMNGPKKVDDLGSVKNPVLRSRIRKRLRLKPKQYQALLKDLFLIEAALVSDKIVISREEEVRRLLGQAAQELPELGDITWVNPDDPAFDCIVWLEQGAKPVKECFLGPAGNRL